jgi:hypothetical protein
LIVLTVVLVIVGPSFHVAPAGLLMRRPSHQETCRTALRSRAVLINQGELPLHSPRRQIPIAPAAPLVPHTPRFPALALFRRRPIERVDSPAIAGVRKPAQHRKFCKLVETWGVSEKCARQALITLLVQADCRSLPSTIRSRLAWSTSPQHHLQSLCASSRHRRRP